MSMTPGSISTTDSVAVAGSIGTVNSAAVAGSIGTAGSVGVVGGTAHAAYLKAFFPKAQTREFGDLGAAETALRRGETDYLFADGLNLALNVGAMLIAFVSLIALVNGIIGGVAGLFGVEALTIQDILGHVFAPLMYLLSVPWSEAQAAGAILGEKVIVNEFVAYTHLADIVNGKVAGISLSDEGRLIATYALCGFANFSSIAIQIGGIGGLAPDRRGDLAWFGLRAVLGGSIATFMTATIAGVLSHFG